MISAVVSNSLHRLKYLSSRPRPKLIRLLGKLCRRKIASCDQVGLRGYESVRGRHLIGYAIVLFFSDFSVFYFCCFIHKFIFVLL